MRAGRVRAVCVALALLATSCGSGDDDTAVDDPTPGVEPTAAVEPSVAGDPEPTPTAPVAESAPLAVAERSVVFGGVRFTVVGAELSNEDPVSRESQLGLPSDSTFLYIELSVLNPTSSSTLTIDDRRFVALRVGEEAAAFATIFSDDIRPASVIGPGAAGTFRAGWEVDDDFDVEHAVLLFGAEDTAAAVLPLVGLALPADQLRAIPLTTSAVVDGPTTCGPSTVAMSVVSATSSLDLPADIADTGGLPRRALAGEAFIEVEVAVEVLDDGGTGACTGTIVTDDLLAMNVGGVPNARRYVEGDAAIPAGTGDTVTLTVGFMIPRGTDATLVLGRPGGSVAAETFSLP